MQLTSLHPNIRLLRDHAMVREAIFLVPVIILFAQARGITFAQFMAIQAMFSVVMILADPVISPLADKYGRRNAAIVGSVFWFIGHILLLFVHGWQMYALAEIFLGLGIAAYRPALEALLYDSLASVNRKDAHYAAMTQQNRLQSFGGAFAMFAGGWLFTVHQDLPALATAISSALLPFMVWRMQEAPYTMHITRPTYADILRNAVSTLSRPNVRWLVILPGLVSGSTVVLFWSIQPVLTQAGIGAGVISMLMCGYFVVRGLFAGLCPWVVEKLGEKASFGLTIGVMAIGFFGVALLPWWAAFPAFAVGCGFSHMLADSLGREMVHHHVASGIRSSAMGSFKFMGRIISTVTLTGCSVLTPLMGLPFTLMLIGGTTATLAAVALTRFKPGSE